MESSDEIDFLRFRPKKSWQVTNRVEEPFFSLTPICSGFHIRSIEGFVHRRYPLFQDNNRNIGILKASKLVLIGGGTGARALCGAHFKVTR